MKFLLDTCVFIWMLSDPEKISGQAKEVLQGDAVEAFLSAASIWEISIKHGMKKLPLPQTPSQCLPQMRKEFGLQLLEIGELEAARAGELPQLHRDPFDRMLIAQAIIHKLTIITPDPKIHEYAVDYLW